MYNFRNGPEWMMNRTLTWWCVCLTQGVTGLWGMLGVALEVGPRVQSLCGALSIVVDGADVDVDTGVFVPTPVGGPEQVVYQTCANLARFVRITRVIFNATGKRRRGQLFQHVRFKCRPVTSSVLPSTVNFLWQEARSILHDGTMDETFNISELS